MESFVMNMTLPDTCPNPSASATLPYDCAFYTDCLEATYNCGPSGFPLGPGLKYCERFLENEDRFSELAQEWVRDTRVCLKEAMVPSVTDPEGKTCEDVEETFWDDALVKCYVDNGFCDLAFGFREHPKETIKFLATFFAMFDAEDLKSLTAVKQVARVIAECSTMGISVETE